MNTDYGMFIPSRDQIRAAFGSLQRAVEVTGGDLPTLLLYLHNTDRIAAAPPVAQQPGEYAKELREDALAEQAECAWRAQEKPTIRRVAEDIGVCRSVARRLLVAAGKWPKAKAA